MIHTTLGITFLYVFSISIFFLIQTPYLVYSPHLFRSAQFFILLIMPYLYFLQTLHDNPLDLRDLLHL